MHGLIKYVPQPIEDLKWQQTANYRGKKTNSYIIKKTDSIRLLSSMTASTSMQIIN